MNAQVQDIQPDYIDFDAIKNRQQQTWASGDYSTIGCTLQIVGENICETAELSSGSKVLDVAAGNGNASLAAARRFCRVTSTDYVEALLERGEQRAKANGLDIDFQFADAESLPFDDNTYDSVISTFGVMFAPNQQRAAHEMARVCKSGGTIAMSNWAPDGFVGHMFKTIGRHVAPPAGLQPPSRWGDEQTLQEIFGHTASLKKIVRREFVFRYCSVDHFLDLFINYFGPIHKAYAALGKDCKALDDDLRALLAKFNTANDGTLVVPSKYIEAVMTAG